MSKKCELTGKIPLKGHNVSHANNKTKRRFLPNLQKSSMHSSILGKTLQFRVAASTIRTVEKNGGLDEYLTKTSNRALAPEAIALKKSILKHVKIEKQAT